MDQAKDETTLWDLLERVPDHRAASGRRFPLRGILGLTLAAVLSGRDSLAAIARWGRNLTRRQLAEFGITRLRAPCHATYHNVFKGLDIAALEKVLGSWVELWCSGNDVLAIDGKTLRASRTLEYPGVHLLSAFSRALQGVVGQVRVPAESNEFKAALYLLRGLKLQGRVITGEAMFTQKELCREITERGGDYFFVVKDNQSGLKEHLAAAFSAPVSPLGGAASAF